MTWADRATEEIGDRTALACAVAMLALLVVVLL